MERDEVGACDTVRDAELSPFARHVFASTGDRVLPTAHRVGTLAPFGDVVRACYAAGSTKGFPTTRFIAAASGSANRMATAAEG